MNRRTQLVAEFGATGVTTTGSVETWAYPVKAGWSGVVPASPGMTAGGLSRGLPGVEPGSDGLEPGGSVGVVGSVGSVGVVGSVGSSGFIKQGPGAGVAVAPVSSGRSELKSRLSDTPSASTSAHMSPHRTLVHGLDRFMVLGATLGEHAGGPW